MRTGVTTLRAVRESFTEVHLRKTMMETMRKCLKKNVVVEGPTNAKIEIDWKK